jgi:hypothetical protein
MASHFSILLSLFVRNDQVQMTKLQVQSFFAIDINKTTRLHILICKGIADFILSNNNVYFRIGSSAKKTGVSITKMTDYTIKFSTMLFAILCIGRVDNLSRDCAQMSDAKHLITCFALVAGAIS